MSNPHRTLSLSLTLLTLLGALLLPLPAGAQGDDAGELRFKQRQTQVREGDGVALVTVERRQGSAGAVSVDYETQDGSAVAGEDYTAVAGTLSWEDGQQGARVIEIPIADDGDEEGQETFQVLLSNLTGDAELEDDSLTVRIQPSDRGKGGPPSEGAGVFKFDQGNFVVIESAGTAVISVERFRGSEGDVSVRVFTTDFKAVAGEDYEETSEVLEWADGESGRKTLSIPLLDDDDDEPTENVRLALEDPTGDARLDNGRARALLTIKDDDDPDDEGEDEDSPGEIEFARDDFQVIEDEGTAMITVRRKDGSTGAVSVEYSTGDGSATEGDDYTGSSGVLSWDDGEGGSKSFEVEILEDDLVEGNETVELSLSNPTGGATLEDEIGDETTAELTILDNDGETGVCEANETTLCLNDDRFAVSVVWRTSDGNSGDGQAVSFTEDTGFFWFFNADNLEVMVKVLNACSLPGFNSYWVFFAATTNVDFTLTVTDTQSGVVKEYTNPGGEAAEPVQDTFTFETCP